LIRFTGRANQARDKARDVRPQAVVVPSEKEGRSISRHVVTR
jgi:hypothetical protein